jgi:oxaloacetate decarboxylase (Na+ extruding) subunit alpha
MLEHLKALVAAETARTGKRRTIHLTDDTLRDGQQCLWATRMRTEHMLPIAERMDRAGFLSMQAIALVQFDASVLFLNQDPFERKAAARTDYAHPDARRRAEQPYARLLSGGR